MSHELLAHIWFGVICVLMAGYAILDGFDLGVGALHLFVKKDEDRRSFLNAIGPVWDGNAVWLVTLGGAMFAGFPKMYALVFSSFYLPFMALLAAIIFRGVAIEFRSKEPWPWWRSAWDWSFSIASLTLAFLFGVVFGNFMTGIPLDHGHVLKEQFEVLSPYTLLCGVTSVALFTMHGCIYLLMKTEGDLQASLKNWVNPCMIFFILTCITTTLATLIYHDHMVEKVRDRPWLFSVLVLVVLFVANIPREVALGRYGRAFLSSSVTIVALMGMYGMGTFPQLVRSTYLPEVLSMNIMDAVSSKKTLQLLLIIAGIGIPLVISYTIFNYRAFRGKVRYGKDGY